MTDLQTIQTYVDFKSALTKELSNQAEGFVRTGYLLKKARDTDILKDSGYSSVAEFAQAEFGLSKDIVSRYIAINDRFSEGGYSDKLQEKYENYGIAKLQEMLTLPDEVIELMSPEMTRKDIQEMKRDVREDLEEADSNPLGIVMEGQSDVHANMSNLQKALYEYFHEQTEEFVKLGNSLFKQQSDRDIVDKVLDVLAPSGIKMLNARIQGIGRIMISIRGKDMPVEVLNVRTQDRVAYMWPGFLIELQQLLLVEEEETAEQAWERLYGESFPEKKEKVAPVQPEKKEEKPAPKAVSKGNQKTEQQKYDEKQRKLDKQTKERLQQMEDDKKMSTLPSDNPKEPTVHDIRLAAMYFDDVASGRKSFELRKNDRNYHKGDILEMMEFKDGKNTGRMIRAEVMYMLENYTGLTDGYCIMATKVLEVNS